MPAERKDRIKADIADVASLSDVNAHPNVKAMAGDWSGCHRLRVGQYRAIFRLKQQDGREDFEVLQVGPRGGIY
ncbi:MAG: hypothetical protein ABJQ29_11040 [Luteolibacter sp.]